MRLCRTTVFLFTLALAAAVPGFAAEPRSRAHSDSWSTFAFSLRGFLTSLWQAEGCALDPLGRCASAAPTRPTADAGCVIDPLGGCIKAQPKTDAGCRLDPLGGCLPHS